jgi:hypothetical protein
MSGYPIEPKMGSATLDDCARLLSTLRNDYIPDLRIEVSFELGEGNGGCMVLHLVDYVGNWPSGRTGRSVWAELRFHNRLHLISMGSLFDLLIVGYRVIDTYFDTGVDNRPSSLKE